ncbi:phage portal protein [Mycobacteroides salmoniphilum]|uniref:Phage portal protein, SPP1 Gp6-like n=1 Tax=Mycobacteroides salmoniphilum TaxID=404941 RepID=A0A4R8SC66_9MYCO|nr:phage portal protein [Mycobacteroides salmoniphilum]TDZ92151.1 Phage portal protein, SPP1 Gp6-like [Mycobacteroides salmoniphilum]TEA07380.1 Phage portal protein, SPP1 Gp6-like [Mycobacteroides salmoniphilum]
MAVTPEEWLPILSKRIDDNMSRVRLLDRYVSGDAPLPEQSRNTKASWQAFQKMSRTNWGLLIRDSVADRIVPNGITVGGSSDSEIAKQAQRIWRDNRMDFIARQWIEYGLTFRDSFLTCWQGDEGQALITADSPETMCVAADPLQPWRVRAAIRYWRDIDEQKDFAYIWVHGARQKFSRDCYVPNINSKRLLSRISGKWEPVGEAISTDGAPPVVLYANPGGFGEFETHLDDINRVNTGMLQRLTTMAMQAFRQRALRKKDGGAPLPTHDENDNVIDWAAIFEPAPGALWDLPPGVDIWESSTTDIGQMLSATKEDIRLLSAATKTPLPVLMPDSANQSAEGAMNTEKGFIFKCEARLAVAKLGLEAILVRALETEGVTNIPTIDVSFESPARVTLSEKYSAAAQAKAAGESWGSIARNILGYSPDQIKQDGLDRSKEQLSLFGAQRAQNQPPQQPVTGGPR